MTRSLRQRAQTDLTAVRDLAISAGAFVVVAIGCALFAIQGQFVDRHGTDATIANTTIPTSPSCSARRRPIRVSATCPQIGIATILTAAIAPRRNPISLGSNPRPAK
jgi:hypothetical protein